MSGEGPLHFTAGIENREFNTAIEDMERRIRGVSGAAVSGGKDIDRMIDITLENVKIQKAVISDLESQLKSLEQQISKTPAGLSQQELRRETALVRAEFEAEKNTLIELEAAVKSTAGSHTMLRTQIMNLRDELAQMELAGERGTKKYEEIREELGRLSLAYRDVQDQAKIFGSQRQGFDALISGISGVAGAASAAQGTLGLFVGQNENLQKIMLRVQSLMAITIGLQQVQKTLYKDSAFMLVTVNRAKQIYTGTINRLTVALWGSTAAAKAMLGALTLGLSVAIGAIIFSIDRMLRKQRESAEAQRQMFDSISQNATQSVVQIRVLQQQWSKLGDDLQSKERFVRDNADAFKSLGTEINNVAEAENLLTLEAETFVQAQLKKAASLYYFQKAVEKQNKIFEIDDKLKTPEYKPVYKDGVLIAPDEVDPKQLELTEEFKQMRENRNKLEDELTDLTKMSADFETQFKEIMTQFTTSSADVVLGPLGLIDKELAELRKKLLEVSEKEIPEIQKQIADKEKQRAALLGKSEDLPVKGIEDNLRKVKALYQDYYNWIERFGKASADQQFESLVAGGESFLEYLRREIEKLEKQADITPEQRDRLSILIASEKDLLGTKSRMQALDEEISQAKKKYESLVDYITFLNKRIELVPDDGSEAAVQARQRIEAEIEAARKEYVQRSRQTFSEIIKETANFAERRLLIEQEFQRRLLELDKESLSPEQYERATEGLRQRRSEQLEAETMKVVQQSEAWQRLTFDIDSMTKQQAQRYLVSLKDMVMQLGLQGAELVKVLNLLTELGVRIREAEKNNLAKTFIDAGNALNDVAAGLDKVNSELAEAVRNTADIIGNLGNAQQSITAFGAEGGATIGNAIGVFSATANIATGIVGLLNEITGAKNKRALELEHQRTMNARQLHFEILQVSNELEKQLELISRLPTGTGYEQLLEALNQYLDDTAAKLQELEFVIFDPQGISDLRVNIDAIVDWSGLDDQRMAVEKAFAAGLISQEDYDLAMQYIGMIEDGQQRIFDEQRRQAELLTGMTTDALVNSIVDGVKQGKRSIEDFADTFEEMMRNAVIRSLVLDKLSEPLGEIIDMVFEAAQQEGGITSQDIANFTEFWENEIGAPLAAVGEAMDQLPFLASTIDEQLSGSIKGITEQTAGIIAGQMTAMRMSQSRQVDILNNQLSYLAGIERNTSYNRHLERIDRTLLEINEVLDSNRNDDNRIAG